MTRIINNTEWIIKLFAGQEHQEEPEVIITLKPKEEYTITPFEVVTITIV